MADKASAPLKRVTLGATEFGKKITESENALKKLQRQQQMFARARDLQQRFGENKRALDKARADLGIYLSALKKGGDIAKSVGKPYREAQARVNELAKAHRKLTDQLVQMRGALTQSGVKNLATDEARLAEKIKSVNTQLERQRPRLEAIERINARHTKTMMHIGMASATGYAMRASGSHFFGAMGGVLGPSKHGQIEEARIRALGRPDGETNDAIAYAKKLRIAGASAVESIGMMGDALSVFNDAHEAKLVLPMMAKMKAANQVLYGEEGGDRDRQLLDMLKVGEGRGGGKDEAAMAVQADWIQKAINASRGRVDAEQYRQALQRGGVMAKGMSDAAFFGLEPLIQEVGSGGTVGNGLMSAYQNVINGKATKGSIKILGDAGLIGDYSKVDHDKAGQIAHIRAGALKGSRQFQSDPLMWVHDVLLPTLKSRGYTTPEQIKNVIGGMFSNRSASNLFVTMAQQIDQLMAARERLGKAKGIDATHQEALGTPDGKEQALKARRDDLYKKIGDAVMPTYVKLLEVLTKVVEKVAAFVEQNPTIVKWVAIVAAAFMGLVMAGGSLIIVLASIFGPIQLIRFALARMGVAMFGARTASQVLMSALRGMWSALGAVFRGAWRLLSGGLGVLRSLGTVLMTVGRVAIGFLFTPLGAALALLAGAAYLVYRNWDGIVGGLRAIWGNIKECVLEFIESPAKGLARLAMLPVTVIQYTAGVVGMLFEKIAEWKIPFISAGAKFIAGILEGIASKAKALKDGVVSMASDIGDWFREKLGIHSPSRVFMEFGGFIGEGAALGIERSTQLAKNAALALAAVTLAPVGMAANLPALQGAGLAQPGAGAAGARMGGSSYTITINAAPGMAPQAIARAVAAELDRRERAQRSRVISQMSDTE